MADAHFDGWGAMLHKCPSSSCRIEVLTVSPTGSIDHCRLQAEHPQTRSFTGPERSASREVSPLLWSGGSLLPLTGTTPGSLLPAQQPHYCAPSYQDTQSFRSPFRGKSYHREKCICLWILLTCFFFPISRSQDGDFVFPIYYQG